MIRAGVFDSGIGGMSVAGELRKKLPGIDIVYFGDTKRVPYGTKTPETVRDYCRQIVKFLRSKKADIIVIACNTATAHAYDALKAENDIPIIGVIEAGSRGAVAATKNNKIGLIATEGTVKSGAYEKTIHSFRPDAQVFQVPCQDLVTLVEAGHWNDEIVKKRLKEYLKAFDKTGIDTLIMGCTHFPILRDAIQEILPEVKLVNPADITVEMIEDYLEEAGTGEIIRAVSDGGSFELNVSGMREEYAAFAGRLLGEKVETINVVDIDKY